jgi:hypothetical protein
MQREAPYIFAARRGAPMCTALSYFSDILGCCPKLNLGWGRPPFRLPCLDNPSLTNPVIASPTQCAQSQRLTRTHDAVSAVAPVQGRRRQDER